MGYTVFPRHWDLIATLSALLLYPAEWAQCIQDLQGEEVASSG